MEACNQESFPVTLSSNSTPGGKLLYLPYQPVNLSVMRYKSISEANVR